MTSEVLVVDDSLTIRMDLGEAFEEARLSPTLCASIAAAREALRSTRFALVVLDVLLPDGDGLDLLKELKSDPSTAATPVMLLSTEAEVRDRVRGMATGADEYVGKPYDIAHVLARATDLLGRRNAEGLAPTPSVLVIDDSATFREELREALEAGGYRVRVAETGEEGLRLAFASRPAAIVVDAMLPGIDGPTVVRRLKSDSALRQIPCLMLTASEQREDELRGLEAGADAYVRKGEDLRLLLTRLAALLRLRQGAAWDAESVSLLGPKRLLAVDDSLTYLQELAEQLRQEDYDVVLARSGEEALDLLVAQPVDCILLDLVMPGLSGQETCRQIKGHAQWRAIPLVMLTAHDGREAMIAGIDAGADDYLAKSCDFEVLRARLRAQLRRKHYEDENRRMRLQAEAAEERVRALNAQLEQRVIERTAQLEAAVKELESFSYSVSHDLRAPLRAIGGFTSIVIEDYGESLPEDGQRLLQMVGDNVARMNQLIDDLLEFSRLSRRPLQRREVDLADLARQVLAELQWECGQRRVEVVVGDLPPCHGDPGLLRQVLANLLGNALKFTSGRDPARIEVGCQAGDEVVYCVRDNGAGFDMRFADKLFGVFQRLHAGSEFEGTGIGLATVQRIIHRHGGRIWAEAEVGRGATFYFTLGGAAGTAEPSPDRAPGDDARLV